MSNSRILVFSSSRAGNSAYLETAVPVIKEFLGDKVQTIAFIPFASVDNNDDAYTRNVQTALQGLPYTIETVTTSNAKQVIGKADVIMVGGGNTFKLLHDIYKLKLTDLIRDKVNKGAAYIGWSAGSNITGPTIGTTNDMPIIEPESMNALGILPFQINPHYINTKPDGHNGETRDQRLEEFIKLNAGVAVVALPEGTALKLENDKLLYMGNIPGVLFTSGEGEQQVQKNEIQDKADLSFLM